MRYLVLFALSLLFQSLAMAGDLPISQRYSSYNYIFRISNEQALKYLKNRKIEPEDSHFFTNLVDSFPFNSQRPALYTPGHYLEVIINEGMLSVEYFCRNNLDILIFNNGKTLAVKITDLQGNIMDNLVVRANNLRVSYDHEKYVYTRDNSSAGFLTALHNDHLNIVALEVKKAKPFSHFVQIPRQIINLGLRMPALILDVVNNPSYHFWELEELWWDFSERLETTNNGYMVLNKPMYRPGEEVKFKAWVFRGKRPLKQDLDLYLTGHGKRLKLSTFEGYRHGAYEGSFLLHDSLDLTQNHQYSLLLRNSSVGDLITARFVFEDYELKDINLELSVANEYHFRGYPATISVKGTDQNDLPLYDARIDFAVIPQRVTSIFTESIFIPDTIFRNSIALNPSEPTIITISDTLFADINIDYEVVVRIVSHDNQIKEKKQGLSFFNIQKKLDYVLSGNQIRFHYRENGISKPTGAVLDYIDKAGDVTFSREVELPWQEDMNPGIYCYQLTTDNLNQQFFPGTEDHGISIEETRCSEKVSFELFNPHQLMLNWYLYKNDREFSSGSGIDFKWEEAAARNDQFLLRVFFSWGGEVVSINKSSVFQPNRLFVSVDQPQQVLPGQTATIEITVTDAKGNPAKGTDLTAFSWSGKFQQAPILPKPDYKPFSLWTNARNFYQGKLNNTFNTPLFNYYNLWKEKAGLDSLEYYSFRFPGSVIYSSSTNSSTGITQVAPFIFNNGLIVPIQALYLNDKPVYASISGNAPPVWSFKGEEGFNRILFRTSLGYYELDSIFLESGKKTFISIEASQKRDLRSGRASDRISKRDRAEIFPHLYYFNNFNGSSLWLEDDLGFYPLNSHRYGAFAGPLYGDTISLFSESGRILSFKPFTHIQYYISGSGIKKISPLEKTWYPRLWWGNSSFASRLGDEVLTRQLYMEKLREQRSLNSIPNRYNLPSTTKQGKGRIIIHRDINEEYIEKWGIPVSMLVTGNDGSFLSPFSVVTIHDLSPGQYYLFYVFSDGLFLKKGPFVVCSDGSNHVIVNFDKDPEYIKEADDKLKMFPLPAYQHKEGILPTSSAFTGGILKGRVFEASTQEPLPGVTVMIKGTSQGTVTDLYGYYELYAPAAAVLSISFIGMETVDLFPVNNYNETLMYNAIAALQETVVVGYGVQGMVSGVAIRGASSVYGNRTGFIARDDLTLDLEMERSSHAYILPDFSQWTSGGQPGNIRSNFSDYGYWQPRLTTDSDGKASFEVTFPDDLTSWDTWVVAMNHKNQSGTHGSRIRSFQALSAQLSMPRFLVTGDTAFVPGRLTSYLNDTIQVNSFFELNGLRLNNYTHELFRTATDRLLVSANQTDSLSLKYHTEYNGFIDGEKRSIPVFSKGIRKAEGDFWHLGSDTVISLHAKREMTLYAMTNVLDVFFEDIERLINFPYNCNEQEASRLIALLAKKKLFEATGQRFSNQRQIRSVIRELEKNQNNEGLWSWWGNSRFSSAWVSEHVIRSLIMAIEHGYEVNLRKDITAGMLQWIWENQPNSRTSIYNIMLMMNLEFPYQDYLAEIHEPDYYTMLELRQLSGEKDIAGELLSHASESLTGKMFFRGYETFDLLSGTVARTLTAYRILRREDNYEKEMESIFNYLLEIRDIAYPSNTYSSSLAIYSMLPALLKRASNEQQNAILEIDGELYNEFPLKLTIPEGSISGITKKGGGPVYLTAYSYIHIEDPSEDNNDISVSTRLLHEGNLKTSQNVVLQLNLSLEKEAEYLMIEVPIPAGCSYHDDQNTGPHETHRELRRDKAVLFFQRLLPGTYTYQINLLPRYPGVYTLNPAKAQLMYFPTFSANNSIQRVIIEHED